MGVPTWYFDGDKKRIYEVPPLSSYVVDGSGYRIYTPDDIPSADKTLYVDVKKDLWSRWVDWHDTAKWSLLAIAQSSGAMISLAVRSTSLSTLRSWPMTAGVLSFLTMTMKQYLMATSTATATIHCSITPG